MRTDAARPSLPPTNPYHIARAYGVAVSGASAGAAAARPPASADESQARTPGPAQRLVAGVVPGHVDFSGDQPRQAGAALPLYRHPADKNAAATAVALGRTLDVSA